MHKNNLRGLLEASNISLTQLAEFTGIAISSLSKIQNGQIDARQSTVKKITDALGVTPGAFYSESTVMIPERGSRMVPVVTPELTIAWSNGSLDHTQLRRIPVEFSRSPNTFAFQVKGSEMEPHLFDGDILIVDPKQNPRPKDIVVFHDGNMGYARFFALTSSPTAKLLTYDMVPADKYSPVHHSTESSLEILGTVVAFQSQRMFRGR